MKETIETAIIGGGQAGLALSYHLGQRGREHIVLEKASQPGESWRNQRWDSFTLVTPNWSFRLPGAEYQDADPDGFMPRAEIVRRFEDYARTYRMPVRYDTQVTSVEPVDGRGYRLVAGDLELHARNVVVASGMYQKPKIPAYAAAIPGDLLQIHSSAYRNPQSLPPGAVLVAGAGQSGCQIAEELRAAGREVWLSTCAAPRAPRRYRGRDVVTWLEQSGFFLRTPAQLTSLQARFSSNPLLTGKDGGHVLDLHQFYRDGIHLLGRTTGCEMGRFSFAGDLQENLARSEKVEADIVKMIDGYITRMGLDCPEERIPALTDAYAAPDITTLDPRAEGIGTVIWACGYSFDYSMVKLPVIDAAGFPLSKDGTTAFPGLYFLGMPWLPSQKAGILLGVGETAARIADAIAP